MSTTPMPLAAAFARAAAALALTAAASACAHAAAGWSAEFTVRVESAGKLPVTSAPAKTAVTGATEWASRHELHGTLSYTQKLRGAVARNQPDRDNEQRYESWLARVSSTGLPAQLTLSSVRSTQSSGRVIAVDGEGAASINRANAGKIGKVEHVRSRTEVRVEGADGARIGGAYLQIDRVTNQIRFETPTIEINPSRATVTEQSVARLNTPPAAGEWDRNDTFMPNTAQDLRLPRQLPYPVEFVFDVPAHTLAEAREITLTQAFKAGFFDEERDASRGSITLVLRRIDTAAPAAGPSAQAAPAAPAAAPTPAGDDAKKAEAAAPTAAPAPTTPTLQDAAKAVDRLRGLFGR